MARYSRARPSRARSSASRSKSAPRRAVSRTSSRSAGVLRIVIEQPAGRDGAAFGVPGMTPAAFSGPRRAKF